MTEYIERGGKLFPTPFSSEEHGDYRQGWNHCLRAIYQMPAADVVAVVRCGECMHWERYDNTAGCGYCHKVKFEYGASGYVFNPVRKPDFYCADGKRKNGGQDDA